MIVKVKEPQAVERAMLREGQVLFTYLHLAPDLEQTEDLIKSGATCIAYETVTAPTAACRCWRRCPKSPAACRSRPARTAWRRPWRPRHAARRRAGRGPAKVVILGGGVVGANAALMAVGLGRR
jgi:alanine dehydrogenase